MTQFFLYLLLGLCLPLAAQSSDSLLAWKAFERGTAQLQAANYDSARYYFGEATSMLEPVHAAAASGMAWIRYIDCLNEIGTQYNLKGRFDDALESLSDALEAASLHLPEKHMTRAYTLNRLGNVYENRGEFDQAMTNYQASLDMRRALVGEGHIETAKSYANIGNIYTRMGTFEKAIHYHQLSLTIKEKLLGTYHRTVASSYNNIGIIYTRKGDYRTALANQQKALEIRLKIFDTAHSEIAQSYDNLGIIYRNMGDTEQALDYYKRALSIKVDLFGEKHPSVARTYQNIGNIYFEKNDLTQAREFYQKALEIKQENLDSEHPELATTYKSLAVVSLEEGDYPAATSLLKKSTMIRVNRLPPDHPLIGGNYTGLADIAVRTGKADSALIHYHKALEIFSAAFGKHHPRLAQSYIGIGHIQEQRGQYEPALASFQKALQSLVPDFVPARLIDNPGEIEPLSRPYLVEALTAKGKTFYKRSQHSTGARRIDHLQAAIATLRLAVANFDIIRSTYAKEASKLVAATRSADVFEIGALAAVELYKINKQRATLEEAFWFAEKSKSGILLSSLQESRAKQFAGIPDTLLDYEKQLRTYLADLETQIQSLSDRGVSAAVQAKIRTLEERYFESSRTYQSLIGRFEAEYPRYFDLKFRSSILNIGHIQRLIDEQSAVLAFMSGEKRTFLFIITGQNSVVVELAGSREIERTVQALLNSINSVDFDQYQRVAYQAYSLLLGPAEAVLEPYERLIIIPDGVLNRLPFEALLTVMPDANSEGNRTIGDLPFLLRNKSIAYNYSATLYGAAVKEAARVSAEFSYAGFAPVFPEEVANSGFIARIGELTGLTEQSTTASRLPDGTLLPELTFARQEVEKTESLFRERHLRTRAFLLEEATEQALKENASRYKYIHIASHGFVNSRYPALSGVAFHRSDKTNAATGQQITNNDGILYAGECYNLDLQSKLVVISSCESGSGTIVKGEGLMAITRGFIYSGALNLAVSLWKVNDKHTFLLITDFFQHILAGQSHAEALRLAKLSLLQHPETAFPKSWSSFILIGQ